MNIPNSPHESLTFQGDGVTLHAVAGGPLSGPIVVLLHGFPEFWYGWRKQIEPLANSGFRVIVPDQRGYNLSSKPPGIDAYALPRLTADVIAIIDHLGAPRIYLAGHDWGAAVAWNVALRHPERLHRLAILNLPHPAVMLRYLKTSPRQLGRSSYIVFFQLPWLPEAILSAQNFSLMTASLLHTSRPGTFTSDDLQHYREAWALPGALTAMLNWYRALRRHPLGPATADSRIQTPTRILWGAQDSFLLAEMAEASLRYCSSGELIKFPAATHWVQHEEAERVSQLLIEFFRSAPPSRA